MVDQRILFRRGEIKNEVSAEQSCSIQQMGSKDQVVQCRGWEINMSCSMQADGKKSI